ncbi:gas vesicle accessory protein GvpU [Aquibacillus rhizosphaerae]|uniref:Gas vesicle accessory protein GvpU n=1 Tax=Aquibacillus rhizosphaerae TaxID=3051431 RepID=A0ABT7L5A1_9BACI|nr:gas vesicle accessory protein GvpU [Aquibacillus sp. LR5S19]MDL4840380.1 gas vesicle accessory protein GvpU [Aquibacillus sp. LR5S19]
MSNKKQDQVTTDDALLDMLLSLVEEDGVELAVTLTVNGAVISGYLIGASDYYEGITESALALQDNTLSKIIAKKFNDMKNAYVKQKQNDEENNEKTPTFIHMKNATYFKLDKQDTSGNTTWWRGRISSVDAVSFDYFT